MWLIAACALLGLALAAPSAAASGPAATVFDSLVTIRSDQPLPPGGSASAELSAAANEFESFQVVVEAGSDGLGGVRVDAGQTLTGPGGATIPASNLTFYREVDYQVTTRSDAEGATGAWPDALIPERDPIYGENRNAFPVDLAAGGRVTAWVDVLVPDDASAGDYQGSILVSGGGGTVSEVPLSVRVRGFTLPSTATLRSAFGGTGGAGIDQTLYEVTALNNRVTLSNVSSSRFSSFRPLLEGTDPRPRLPGAEMTAIAPYGCSGSCVSQWRSLAEQHPVVAERFLNYVCDEPHSASEWSNCHSKAAAADAAWPGVRKLLTSAVSKVPAWASDLSAVADAIHRDGQAAHDSWRGADASRKLWPYTSCDSFSCGEYEGSEYNGWPGYAIDQPASQARAMGWLAFNTGAEGELYWSTTYSVSTAWTNQYCCGGNGDGNLFYPGTTDRIGGAHQIPVESMRLKRIRDGREDYEYLNILARRGHSDDAMAVSQGLFPSMKQATTSPGAVSSARAQLAGLIESAGLPQRTVTVTVNGPGAGSVSGPGIRCPGDCTATLSDGISTTLTAVPGAGAKLAGWGGACAGADRCRLTMDSDKSVSATFDAAQAPKKPREPDTKIVDGPSGKTRDRTPTFRLSSSEPNSTFQCRADRSRWRPCASAGRLRRLAYGRHVVYFRAHTAAGNWDKTPARRRLRVVR